ncbi:MAG: lipoate--protein ligase family protein [Rhodospirillaceae bacterium]|jgi:lipoate-protein ligase A|nr:lipoate--protein ligase family protein [Rhodospirillaceae bacterium]MBT5456402.1 lipoate--protein ligase family protein [Rhodospirillaceae bacterium]
MADQPWRLIVDENSYADFSVSVSPAIERAVVEGASPPTVYLNIFDSDSITIGINEDPEQALDLAFCAQEGVGFRRRPNGGGPVYAGAGSAFLIYFLPTSHGEVPETTTEAFPKILSALAETLVERYGFPAEYRPLNDVQVEGRKLIPTSLKIENGVMTFRIVINVKPIDTEFAGKIMPMPPEKVKDKVLKDMTSRFTCLEREAGKAIDAADLEAMSRAAVSHAFGETDLVPGAVSDLERNYADEFRAQYESEDWLYAKSERTRFGALVKSGDAIGRGRAKAVGGLIWATLVVRDGMVLHAIVNGDWHPRPLDSVGWLEEALIGAAAEPAAIRERAEKFLASDDVEFAGVTADDIMAAMEIALGAQALVGD